MDSLILGQLYKVDNLGHLSLRLSFGFWNETTGQQKVSAGREGRSGGGWPGAGSSRLWTEDSGKAWGWVLRMLGHVNVRPCAAPCSWHADLLTYAQSPLGHTEGTQILRRASGFWNHKRCECESSSASYKDPEFESLPSFQFLHFKTGSSM